ncbi:hypothetical protein TNCV_1737781 [Trichonephila clavipes]|nr:hypothetical protein TNCV_1737781 [Trichonephila clavipes]
MWVRKGSGQNSIPSDSSESDHRPSDLLHQMKSLAGSKISEEFLKTWYKRLSQQVKAFPFVSKVTQTNLVEIVDKIISPTDISSINKQDQPHAISCSY